MQECHFDIMIRPKFVVTDIRPKSNAINYYHEEMLGQPGFVLELEPGKFGWLSIVPKGSDEYHRFRTSPVLDVKENDDSIQVETRNTFYTLGKIKKSTDDSECPASWQMSGFTCPFDVEDWEDDLYILGGDVHDLP